MSAQARRGARLARIVHVASLVILAAVAVLVVFTREGGAPPDPLWGFATIVVIGGYSTLGRLIVTRAGNRIGWVFLAMALAAAAGLPAEAYVQSSFAEPYVPSLPGTELAGWLANLAPALIALAIPMLFLLFPTGSPPSPGWRWVAWVWLVGTVLSIFWLAFRPGSIYGEPGRFSIENPFPIDALEGLGPLFLNVGAGTALLAGGAGIASLVVRFRRAGRDEAQQIKWLMAVGVVAAAILVLMWVLEAVLPTSAAGDAGLDDLLWVPLVLVVVVGPALATTVAVFRYRLYGIDVVIRKAVVSAILIGFITLVYVAVVVGLGSLLTDDLVLSIAATALVAVAFQPVRERANRFANRLVYGKRATPYEVLARFSERVGGTYATEDLLPRTARVIAEGTAAEGVEIWLRIGDAWRRSAAWPVDDEEAALPAVGDDLSGFEGVHRAVPIRHHGELLGAVTVRKPPNEPLTPAEAKLLDDLAGQAGLVVSNARLTAELRVRLDQISARAAELRASRQRIVATQDAERRRLERNIHDGAQQHLVALAVKLRLARSMLERDPEKGAAILGEVGEQVGATAETLGALALGIYPPVLEERGLVAALQAQARFGTLPVRIEDAGVGRLPIEVEAAVYFVCLEALQNAAKYAKASQVIVRLSRREGEVRFEVADDGAGFLPSANGPGTGLSGMRDRLSVLGGSVEVVSAPGLGTTVRGTVPLVPSEVPT